MGWELHATIAVMTVAAVVTICQCLDGHLCIVFLDATMTLSGSAGKCARAHPGKLGLRGWTDTLPSWWTPSVYNAAYPRESRRVSMRLDVLLALVEA